MHGETLKKGLSVSQK